MNKVKKEHWPAVIIMNGRPYQLIKLMRENINDPCSMCDLRQECGVSDYYYNLLKICKSDDRDDRWYFEEDWTIFDKPLYDFLNPELAEDFLDK